MLGGLFCTVFGIAMIALVLYADRSAKSAKRTGIMVTAQVIGQEVEVTAKRSRFYHTHVLTPAPMPMAGT